MKSKTLNASKYACNSVLKIMQYYTCRFLSKQFSFIYQCFSILFSFWICFFVSSFSPVVPPIKCNWDNLYHISVKKSRIVLLYWVKCKFVWGVTFNQLYPDSTRYPETTQTKLNHLPLCVFNLFFSHLLCFP